jgi:filamentous hemagglutinin
MNKHTHRLVFSRRHGMLVAVSENATAAGKAASGQSRQKRERQRPQQHAQQRDLAAYALLAAALVSVVPALAQTKPPSRPAVVFGGGANASRPNLPQPYTALFNSPNAPPAQRFVNDTTLKDQVSWKVEGNVATFNQGKVPKVILN